MSESSAQSRSVWLALFGVLLLIMGVFETFVTPDPDSFFGEALLVFAPAMLLIWWSGRTGSRPLYWLGQGLATVGLILALYDIARDLFGG